MKQILDNLLAIQTMELSKERLSPSGTPREELRKTIPVQLLEHFDRLRSRGKKGVAFVRNGVCGQCHMQVAVGLLALLRRQDSAHRCANCGAYLYYLAEEPAPLQLPPRSVKPVRRGRPKKIITHVA